MASNDTSTAKSVTIACKLPNGLVLQLCSATKVAEHVMGGGSREVTQHRKVGDIVTVFGNAHPQNAGPKCMIVAGYALTPDVDAQFWTAWLAQNKDLAAVKNHLIFAYEKESDVKAAAKDNVERKSGLERLDPNKLPRGIKAAKETPVEV